MRNIAHNTRQTAQHEIRWHSGSSERTGCNMQPSSEGHSADQAATAQSKCQRALPQQEWIAAISQRLMTAALSRLVSRLYVRGLAVALLGIDQQRHAHARCDGAQRLEVAH